MHEGSSEVLADELALHVAMLAQIAGELALALLADEVFIGLAVYEPALAMFADELPVALAMVSGRASNVS